MKRVWLLVALLALIAPSAFAQRAFQFRISVPAPTLGLGLEADLQRNLVAQLYGDILFRNNVGFLLGGGTSSSSRIWVSSTGICGGSAHMWGEGLARCSRAAG